MSKPKNIVETTMYDYVRLCTVESVDEKKMKKEEVK